MYWLEVEKAKPIRPYMTCACCGAVTSGRQWDNRDTGYGLCSQCAVWLSARYTPEEMQRNYGVPGVHYNIEPTDE